MIPSGGAGSVTIDGTGVSWPVGLPPADGPVGVPGLLRIGGTGVSCPVGLTAAD